MESSPVSSDQSRALSVHVPCEVQPHTLLDLLLRCYELACISVRLRCQAAPVKAVCGAAGAHNFGKEDSSLRSTCAELRSP